MSEFDAQTILKLTADLARNVLAAHMRRYSLPDLGGAALAPYEQQLIRSLAPGLVAFVGRLTAGLPPEYDARPALARFCADPATAAALERYGAGEVDGAAVVAAALLAAGWPEALLDAGAFEEALAAWAAAAAEVARLDAAANPTHQQAVALYQQTAPAPPNALRAAMAELVHSLAKDGLSFIDAGHIVAADGYTILFSWRGQSAGRDDVAESAAPEEWAAAEPEELAESAGPETMGESGESEAVREPATEPPSITPAPEPPSPLPEPPAPQPPPQLPVDEVLALRLDTAAPPQVTTGLPFDLAAAIRRAAAPPLAPADLTQHESAAFAAILPAGAAFLTLRIQVAAPDCDIHGGDTRPLRLFPGQDGPTVYFQLTPRRAGPLSIIVTVYQETDWVGSTRLRTEAGAAAAAAMSAAPVGDAAPRAGLVMNVVSQPLGQTEVNLKTLRDALDDAYSDAELRDLCFELEVDYEDLPGDGQAAKARELVLFCKRRGLLAALVACVMRDRPLAITN